MSVVSAVAPHVPVLGAAAIAPVPLTHADMLHWSREIHDDLTKMFTALDGGGSFTEDAWERPGGGGGWARVLIEGTTFEKAGVNRFEGGGVLPAAAALRLGGRAESGEPLNFFATGVSIVVHPRSPMIPTVHLNVRYFELTDMDGRPVDAWFGGGTDLTPYYPCPEDVAHFHRALRTACDAGHPSFHPRFKPWCDDYFRNVHRQGERRGVGGVFFDHLRPVTDEGGLTAPQLLDFTREIGRSLHEAYAPLVSHRRDTPWGERERAFQLFRRGRYVEFNLLHDRGTTFGLQTGARVESVLMSLPPLAAWPYDPHWEAGSFEAELQAMLEPRDWA